MHAGSMMLNMLKRLQTPPETAAGSGALRRLQCLEPGRACVIAARSAEANGILAAVTAALQKSGLNTACVLVPSRTPRSTEIAQTAALLASTQPQWIVALGGGSVLDLVKFAWLVYENPACDLNNAPVLLAFPLRQKARLIAIPTTAGSGAEASQAAVRANADGRIQPHVIAGCVPDIVILDPAVTLSLPEELAYYSGVDALAHALEAFVSRLASPLSRAHAGEALRMIFEHLPSMLNGPSLETREQMLTAAYLAGLAQSAASTGLTHALAHALTSVCGISHAQAVAAFLLPVAAYNAETQAWPYEAAARASGLSGTAALLAALRGILARNKYQSSRLRLDEKQARQVAGLAMEDPCAKTNPRRPEHTELLALVTQCR